MTHTTTDTLAAALARSAIELPPDQVEQLDRYCRRLWEWNSRLNLTRHTTYDKFVVRDVVDSLAFEPFLEPGTRVLDVGTGGGVPGVVLAIVRPDLELTLCESVAKKAKAVGAIVAESGLSIPVVHARAEELLQKQSFDTLVVRAVAPLPKLLRWFAPHWNAIGQLLILKGPKWAEERADARHGGLLQGLELRKLSTYQIPGTDSQSVLLRVQPH